ncbi:peptidylprolyl isomerase [uncultured Anaerococcus sp.]|uniref:peptidylprolyl isomerase n=1 Tax=uncultured Anaerococcus sp. TaxID=293428 RepID=UPI00260BF074|nr:peptidylprolyl isomerase [uncultured Anaerococcus sp.]
MENNNKLLAEVNGKKIYRNDVISFMQNIEEGQRFQNEEGIKVLTDEMVNQEIVLADAYKNKLDEEEEFKNELSLVKDNMLKNYAMHKIFESVNPTDDELKKYYEENKEVITPNKTYTASHILVDDETKAEDIYKEIEDGLDFKEAAKKYSKDPSAASGGSLGTFPKGVMVKEFQDGLDSLEIGEISKPVKSQFGYHLIKLEDINDAEAKPFEEVKDQVYQTYLMVKRQEKYLEKLNEISKDAEVKKYY